MRPGLMAGVLLMFVSALGEFVASIVLWDFDTKTIAVEIYSQYFRNQNVGMACAYSTVLIVAVAIVLAISRRFVSKGIA